MSNAELDGRFVWYDLMTTDPEAAAAYYTGVVGWSTQLFEGGEHAYTMFTVEGQAIGGTMTLSEDAAKMGAPPHWLAYVGVEDLADSCERAAELGGRVLVPPTGIPTVGRFAVIADPQGAVFALFQPAEPMQLGEVGARVGDFSWHELATTDVDAALRFYGALLGWVQIDTLDLGEMGPYVLYGRDGRTLGGFFRQPPDQPGPPAWLYYIRVSNIADTVNRIRAHGGQLVNGPMEVPGGDKVAVAVDPQGAVFAVHMVAGAAE